MNELVFKSEKGTPVTNSLLVAEKFEKRHSDVVRAIEELMLKMPDGGVRNFGETPYVHPQNGQTYTMYLINRDGFSLLVMGFTGERALQFKLDFIEAFNKMEATIQKGITELSRKQLAQMVLEAEEEKERLQLTVETQSKELVKQAPKVEYYDKCLESKGYLTVNMIASELGISAVKLNKLLCGWNVQYHQTECYFLYSEYRDKGYTVHRPHPYTDSQGQIKTRQHLYWTEKGKKFIIELYNNHFKTEVITKKEYAGQLL